MTDLPASPRVENARVVGNHRLTPAIHQIRLRLSPGWGPPRPGQFVQIECLPERVFTLRRPFSIARIHRADLGTEIEIVYAVVGEGTALLARRRQGDQLEVIGPLGRGFRPFPGRNPVLVGGGRGVAPLLALADAFRADYPYGTVLFGARSEAQLFPLADLPYPVQIATEDGSSGFAGTVVDLLDRRFERGEIERDDSALFGCGPNAMLRALSEWAAARGLPCQVSLETHFGCGFGICAGCAVPMRDDGGAGDDEFGRYRFACIDGPVFQGDRVDWDGVRG